MSVTRRSVPAVVAAAALAVPLLAAPAAPAQDVFGPCDAQQPRPAECVKETTGGVVDTVRGVCLVREGKYCVATLGDVLDRTLPPAAR